MGFFKKEKEEIVDVQPDRAAYEFKTSEHYDGLTHAMNNAYDVAVMRYVLLQFFNWFKTDFKELPLFAKDPFTDDACNCYAQAITKQMMDITKEKNKEKV